MRGLSVVVAALAALVWSVPAAAVVTTSQVTVVADGQPVAGATVRLSTPTPPQTAAKPAKPPRRPTTAKGERTDKTGKVAVSFENSDDRSLEVRVTVRTPDGRRLTGRTTLGDIADGRPISVTPLPSRFVPPPSASTPPAAPPIDGPTGPIVTFGLGAQGTGMCPNFRTKRINTITDHTIDSDPTQCFSEGFRGSISLGYSWRVSNNWLAGVEVDVGFSNVSKSVAGIPGTIGPAPNVTAAVAANDSVNVKRPWDLSLRGRFGRFVTPWTAIYATAGVAFQQIETTLNCTQAGFCGTNGRVVFSSSQNKMLTGWTAGVGAEMSLTDRIVGRIEYRYSDYGTFSPLYQGPDALFAADIDLRTHTALVGVGLKLGGLVR